MMPFVLFLFCFFYVYWNNEQASTICHSSVYSSMVWVTTPTKDKEKRIQFLWKSGRVEENKK